MDSQLHIHLSGKIRPFLMLGLTDAIERSLCWAHQYNVLQVYMLTTRRDVIAGLGSILLDCSLGCNRPKAEPVTILFMELGTRWLQRQHLSERALQQFESETGSG
jgi:hypothetical protein